MLDRKLSPALMRIRWRIPFHRGKLPVFAGLAWSSILSLECRQLAKTEFVAVGPPRFAATRSGGEMVELSVSGRRRFGATKAATMRNAMQWRREHGRHEPCRIEGREG